MSNEFQLREWILLSMTKGVGPSSMRRLLQKYESPGAVRRAPVSGLAEFVSLAVAENIRRGGRGDQAAEAACRWAQQEGCCIITLADTEYPRLLSEIANPPMLLYVRGNVQQLSCRPLVAVVGSRSASYGGVENTEIFARALAEAGVNVVSGLAQGVDSAAHRGALLGGGGTVAVVGTGIDIIYPKQSRGLAQDIVKSGGAIISEFPLGAPPAVHNFPHRNRIISGLSCGCLVVEATMRSGSLNTAEHAASQGRDVFAVPGSINAPMHRGCHHLIKQGAKLAENVADILEELKIKSPLRQKDALATPPGELLRCVDFAPTSLDDIAVRSGLSADALLSKLLELEMDGKIVSTAGGAYQRL